MSEIRKKRICADEALASFLALGQSRTLPRLRERYCAVTGVIPPALSSLKRWSAKDKWTDRAREHDLAVQAATSKKAIEAEADQRVEISLIVEDTYLDLLGRMREHLARMPQIKTPGQIVELVSAAGLLHSQLLEINRGKMPDQGLLEKLVQQMAVAGGNGGHPTDDEMQELLELAMSEPGKPPN